MLVIVCNMTACFAVSDFFFLLTNTLTSSKRNSALPPKEACHVQTGKDQKDDGSRVVVFDKVVDGDTKVHNDGSDKCHNDQWSREHVGKDQVQEADAKAYNGREAKDHERGRVKCQAWVGVLGLHAIVGSLMAGVGSQCNDS